MYDPQLEKLVDMALEDGVITEKEKDILVKRAKSLGIDLDEFEMYLDSRLASLSNTQNTTSSQNKFGDLLKCPSCGASVPSLTIICKDCGFEFRNIKANSSVKELSEKLEHASATVVNEKKGWGDHSKWFKIDEIKSQIVINFPIPNTKDDLMEFAIFICHNIVPLSTFEPYGQLHYYEKWNHIWLRKFKEIIFKVKILCKDDPTFTETIFNLVNKRKIYVLDKFAIPIAGIIAGVSFILGLFLGGALSPVFYLLLLGTYFVAPIYYFVNKVKPFDNNWDT